MNYRHIYHAGNFADVLKHAVLARIVVYLAQKEAAFRVIDTHAGIGLYDLSSPEAQKTGEWRDGIGRLLEAKLSPAAAGLLAPYLAAVHAANPDGGLTAYPGSPMIVRHLMRRQDRLSALELHPEDARTLAARFAGDFQVRVTALDGWLALGAHLPPKERRGLVLVDPPFEAEGEFDRLADGLEKAHRRFAGGTYALWYPIKRDAPVQAFHRRLRDSGIAKVLACELTVRSMAGTSAGTTGLAGSGLIVVNPPFTLKGELDILLPELSRILSQDGQGEGRSFWITPG